MVRSPRGRYALSLVALAAVYVGAAKTGLAFGRLPGNVTPIWPPTGIALAALLLGGRKLWPGVAVGALVTNALSVPVAAAAGMAVGNTLEAVVGAYLLAQVVRFEPSMTRLRDAASLAILAAGSATMISATLGVGSLRLAGVVPASATWTTWRVWWVGDALGTLTVAPIILVWANSRRRDARERGHVVASLTVLAAIGAAAVLAVGPLHSPYLLFPLIIGAALRYTQRGAATVSALVSVIAVIATVSGAGAFAGGSATAALARMDAFLAVFAVTGLMLAAIVTDRDLAQAALEESRRDLEARVVERTRVLDRDRMALSEAQQVALIGSWHWDVAGDSVEWSDELFRLFGMEPGTTRTTYIDYIERIHPDDRPVAEEAIGKAFETHEGFAFEHRALLPDGKVRWLYGRGRVEVDEDGNVTRMFGTAQDISDRRRAEARFEGLLESAPDGIVVIDQDGIIRLVNRQTEALFGWERSELVGQPLEVLMPSQIAARHPDLRQQYFNSPNTRPMGAGLELTARRRDGSEFPVDISLSPLITEEGTLVSAAVRDVTDRKKAQAAMAHQASHDELTGLPNRVLLADRLQLALDRARRCGHSVVVLFLDVDRFKVINDSLGHSAGDRLLRAIAIRLMTVVRKTESVARFGGDEFVIVAELAADQDPNHIGERVAKALSAPVRLDGTDVSVTVSIGIAVAGPNDEAESLLRDADAAMYRAKEQGRDRWLIFDSAMRAGANERLQTENALRRAIEHGELVTYFQPIVDLTSGQITGVEALARWNDPTGGIVAPFGFIPVAEETGMIVALGETVLRDACRQVADWNLQRAHHPLTVSVNLSARQLLTPGLVKKVEEILTESQLPATLLCLEITESVLLDDADASSRVLNALKAQGVRIAVDDFGTGYSSLTYLKRFPVDILKIDKSFLHDLANKRGDGAIVASLIDLAHAFGLTTIAEGVETDEQFGHLRLLGCELGQGHRWSPALPAVDAEAWIKQYSEDPTRAGFAGDVLPPDVRSGGVRVLLVDDDAAERTLLRTVLEETSGAVVVGEAGDGRRAVALARHYQPEVVLLDLAMPGVGGLEALPLIRAVAPGARVAVMSALDAAEVAAQAFEQGAEAYLSKSDMTPILDFVDAIRSPAASPAA